MVLTETQKIFLDWIDNHPFSKKIYWTGGTALAYLYNHRLSTDLDFFSFDFLAEYELLPFISQIKEKFSVEHITRQNIYNRNIFFFDTHLDSLKMEFTFFPFIRTEKWAYWKGWLEIDTPKEIALNKIHAVTQRHEVKDVFDLYYIFQNEHYWLEELLKWVEIKFWTLFEKRDIIARMNYIAKDLSAIQPMMVKKIDILQIQDWYKSLI